MRGGDYFVLKRIRNEKSESILAAKFGTSGDWRKLLDDFKGNLESTKGRYNADFKYWRVEEGYEARRVIFWAQSRKWDNIEIDPAAHQKGKQERRRSNTASAPPRHRNPYEVLNLPHGASADICKRMRNLLALAWHPDKGGDEVKMKEINSAYDSIERGL